MVFQCINIHQVPREVLKTVASGLGFQHLPWDLVNVNAWKTMFNPYIEATDMQLVSKQNAYIYQMTSCCCLKSKMFMDHSPKCQPGLSAQLSTKYIQAFKIETGL